MQRVHRAGSGSRVGRGAGQGRAVGQGKVKGRSPPSPVRGSVRASKGEWGSGHREPPRGQSGRASRAGPTSSSPPAPASRARSPGSAAAQLPLSSQLGCLLVPEHTVQGTVRMSVMDVASGLALPHGLSECNQAWSRQHLHQTRAGDSPSRLTPCHRPPRAPPPQAPEPSSRREAEVQTPGHPPRRLGLAGPWSGGSRPRS